MVSAPRYRVARRPTVPSCEFYRDRVSDEIPPGTKQAWRRLAIERRRRRAGAEIDAAREAIAGHLALHLAGSAALVAGYLPLPSEPMHPGLAVMLQQAGTRVLLPLTRPDAPLDWAEYSDDVRRGRFGIDEPVGTPLGSHAVKLADAVLVPALLVDARGVRLGRGGGHYDRTLSGLRGELIAVVFDDEWVLRLPAEDHDVRMTAMVTPASGVRQFGR